MTVSDCGFASVKLDSVRFTIAETTSYRGYAENKTDPQVEGVIRDDYSFTQYLDDTSELGFVVTGKMYTDFWCKDFGAAGVVKGELIKDGAVVYSYNLRVPTDRDTDGLPDRWEHEQIVAWNNQYGYSHPKYDLAFHEPGEDWEMKDPDRANTDGGTDMPEHKTTGDSLKKLQEYRGFILDGGNGHTGGHKRLSVARKELLVEVDVMTGLSWTLSHGGGSYPYSFGESDARSIMDSVSAAFGDLTNGLGFDAYYVVDEPAAAQDPLTNVAAYRAWQDAHRHVTNGNANMLGEFVHLGFVDQYDWNPTNGGYASSHGATVAVKTKAERALQEDGNLSDVDAWIIRTALHETTHLIIDTANANGFDANEHLASAALDTFVMSNFGPPNWKSTTFHDLTRRQVDLTHKQSVEH
jgi:hypothetical protein